MKILYRERSLIPEWDDEHYRRNKPYIEEALQEIEQGTSQPYRKSPAGYLLLSRYSIEWIDPRDLKKRVCGGVIKEITGGRVFVGDPRTCRGMHPGDILEVLPDDFELDT